MRLAYHSRDGMLATDGGVIRLLSLQKHARGRATCASCCAEARSGLPEWKHEAVCWSDRWRQRLLVMFGAVFLQKLRDVAADQE